MATPTVTFPCPFCGRRMGVGIALLGKRVRCPHCKQVVLAPSHAGTPTPQLTTPTNPPGLHEYPTPLSSAQELTGPSPPPRQTSPPDHTEPVFNFPPKETAESILSEPSESEDEVFGSNTAHQRPELIEEQPAVPTQQNLPPIPQIHPTQPRAAAPNPFAGLEALPPPVPSVPTSTASMNPWAGLDEASTTPAASPPAVTVPNPTSPVSAAESTHTRPKVPRSGVASGLRIVLVGYALLMTLLAIYGLLIKSSEKLPTDHPLSTIPDTFGEFDPATRKKVAQYKFPIDGELPPQLKAGIGGKIEVGPLVIEPFKVESRPLTIITEGTAGRRETEFPRAVVLHLRIKNTSPELTIFPMDPAFNRLATREDRQPATRLLVGTDVFYGGAIGWPFPPGVTREYEQQQADDVTPLKPGDTRNYVVFTDADPAILQAVQAAHEPLLWRIQIRRGLIDFRGREVPVTAIVGVQFNRDQIQNLR